MCGEQVFINMDGDNLNEVYNFIGWIFTNYLDIYDSTFSDIDQDIFDLKKYVRS